MPISSDNSDSYLTPQYKLVYSHHDYKGGVWIPVDKGSLTVIPRRNTGIFSFSSVVGDEFVDFLHQYKKPIRNSFVAVYTPQATEFRLQFSVSVSLFTMHPIGEKGTPTTVGFKFKILSKSVPDVCDLPKEPEKVAPEIWDYYREQLKKLSSQDA